MAGFLAIIEEYPLYEYKKYILDLYQYNDLTKEHILNTKKQLNIIDLEYGSIFIRRGDKLYNESKYIHSSVYLNLLLEKYSNCKYVFLQTDDYTCYEELIECVANKNIDIKIITLCNNYSRGVVVSYSPNEITTSINSNNSYINSIKHVLQNTPQVINMNNDEKYKHTIDMIVGIDIVLNSKICICDYQSNVSRFIKLAHKDIDSVFDVTGLEFDLNTMRCPAHENCVYDNIEKFRHS